MKDLDRACQRRARPASAKPFEGHQELKKEVQVNNEVGVKQGKCGGWPTGNVHGQTTHGTLSVKEQRSPLTHEHAAQNNQVSSQ